MTKIIRVIDFETTGIPPEADVVEAAFVDVIKSGLTGTWWDAIVRSPRPIGPEARAAHHLSDKEVAEGISWETAQATLVSGSREPNGHNLFCAHNADFEKQFFNPEGSRWICTYKCALRLFPDSPRHSNSVLRYFLPGCDPGERGMPPHRALPDCHVTALILLECLRHTSIDQMERWTLEPPLPPRVPLGKYRNQPWSVVPLSYLDWAASQVFDDRMTFGVQTELKRRRNNG